MGTRSTAVAGTGLIDAGGVSGVGSASAGSVVAVSVDVELASISVAMTCARLRPWLWAASVYTLIGTALLKGVNPEASLKHMLERIADLPIGRVDELVPWSVKNKLSAGSTNG